MSEQTPINYYGWNGTTIKYIGKFDDMQDADEAAKKVLPGFDIWWIFDDETLQDIAAQANTLLCKHAALQTRRPHGPSSPFPQSGSSHPGAGPGTVHGNPRRQYDYILIKEKQCQPSSK